MTQNTSLRQIGLRWLARGVLFATTLAASRLLIDLLRGTPLRPVLDYALFGAITSFFGVITFFFEEAGWLRGVFRDPKRVQELKDRQQALQQDRLTALDSARKMS